MYSTSYRAVAGSNPMQSTHLPLNNGCSRVVNHFATASCSNTAKKHVNIERDKLGGGGSGAPATGAPSGGHGQMSTSVPNHYQDDTEEEEHESGNFCIVQLSSLLISTF